MNRKKIVALAAMVLALLVVCVIKAQETYFLSVQNSITIISGLPQNGAVTLAFDDGTIDQYLYAWPLMQERSMTGSFYIISGSIGVSGKMTALQLADLQAHGNEIASHSVNHKDFTTLSTNQINYECNQSKTALKKLGLNITNFAYPYGASTVTIDAIVKSHYRSARYSMGVMTLPHTSFKVTGQTSYGNTDANDFATYKQAIDQTATIKGWTILYFHKILVNDPVDARTSTATFAQILDYIKLKGLEVLTVEQALNIQASPPPSPPPDSFNVQAYADAKLSQPLTNESLLDWGTRRTGTHYRSIWLRNTGTIPATFQIEPVNLPNNWNLTTNISDTILPNQTVEAILKLEVKNSEGNYNFKIQTLAEPT